MKKIVLAVLVSCFLFSCKTGEKEIKIGVITHLTGEAQTYGNSMKRGIDLAIENINGAGGIKGIGVKAIYEDDQLSARNALSAFKKLTSINNVPVIIGSGASSITMQLAKEAQKTGTILISSISTADSLKYAGDYFFRVVPPNKTQGETAASFIRSDLEGNRIAILYANDDYGISLSKAFKDFLSEEQELVYEDSFNPGSNDFKFQLLKVKQNEPDILFIPGVMPEVALVIKQAREMGITASIIGGDGAYSSDMGRLAGSSAEGSYYTIMSLPPEDSGTYMDFLDKFREKYETDPDIWAVLAYDAALVIMEAMSLCEEVEPDQIKTVLYDHVFEGISGPIDFDEFGEVDRLFSIYRFEDGDFKLYRY